MKILPVSFSLVAALDERLHHLQSHSASSQTSRNILVRCIHLISSSAFASLELTYHLFAIGVKASLIGMGYVIEKTSLSHIKGFASLEKHHIHRQTLSLHLQKARVLVKIALVSSIYGFYDPVANSKWHRELGIDNQKTVDAKQLAVYFGGLVALCSVSLLFYQWLPSSSSKNPAIFNPPPVDVNPPVDNSINDNLKDNKPPILISKPEVSFYTQFSKTCNKFLINLEIADQKSELYPIRVVFYVGINISYKIYKLCNQYDKEKKQSSSLPTPRGSTIPAPTTPNAQVDPQDLEFQKIIPIIRNRVLPFFSGLTAAVLAVSYQRDPMILGCFARDLGIHSLGFFIFKKIKHFFVPKKGKIQPTP